jgi:PhnB protein
MLSDGHCSGKPTFEGSALSLTVGSEAEAERAFIALSEGGQVRMPLGKTFFAPKFGMAKDKFGVLWMVMFSG